MMLVSDESVKHGNETESGRVPAGVVDVYPNRTSLNPDPRLNEAAEGASDAMTHAALWSRRLGPLAQSRGQESLE